MIASSLQLQLFDNDREEVRVLNESAAFHIRIPSGKGATDVNPYFLMSNCASHVFVWVELRSKADPASVACLQLSFQRQKTTALEIQCSPRCSLHFHINRSLYISHTGPLNLSGVAVWAGWRPPLYNVTMKRGKWPSKRMTVTIRVSRFDSVIAHLTGSCRRDDGPAPLLESTAVMRWPPITARPLSSQSLAFLVKIIALFLPRNGKFSDKHKKRGASRRKGL